MKTRRGVGLIKSFGLPALLLMACSSPDSMSLEEGASTTILDPLDSDPVLELDAADTSGQRTKNGKPKHDPVIFVHGCPLPAGFGSVTNYVTSTYWRPLYLELRSRGYPAADWPLQPGQRVGTSTIPGTTGPEHAELGQGGGRSTSPDAAQYLNVFVYQGPPCGPSEEHARQLKNYVDEVREATGAPRVDIVANSLGAIAARLFVKDHGAKRVRDFVILAGVNHGTDMGIVPTAPIPGSPFFIAEHPTAYDGAREVFPAYACDGESPGDLLYELNGCLREGDGLGQVDQTPHEVTDGAGIAYLSIFNVALDELVNPTFSACLNQKIPGDCTDHRVNLPIQVAAQVGEDLRLHPQPDPAADQFDYDTPHGSIRNDEQAICTTVAFVMCRNKAQREPCDVTALAALQAQADTPPPDQTDTPRCALR